MAMDRPARGSDHVANETCHGPDREGLDVDHGVYVANDMHREEVCNYNHDTPEDHHHEQQQQQGHQHYSNQQRYNPNHHEMIVRGPRGGGCVMHGRLLCAISVAGMVLSVPIIAIGVVAAVESHKHACITFIEKPVISIGALLMAASVAGVGLAASSLKGSRHSIMQGNNDNGLIVMTMRRWRPWLEWVYVGTILLLALLMLCFAILTVDITSGESSSASAGGQQPAPAANLAYTEYSLGDYPPWMRHKVQRRREWKEVVKCLQRNGFCNDMPYNGTNKSIYNQSPLSAIQSGCCKPPNACNFGYVDGTHWVGPTTPSASEDCKHWDNDPSLLCYNCSSCKAGVIQETKDRWKKVGVTLFVVLIILVVMYTLFSFIAFQQERKY